MLRALLVVLFLAVSAAAQCAAPQHEVPWLRSESDAFARAGREHRYVLLYLEAVWCHWCHVMDHETYADPAVRKAIAARYVPLRIDQDARPDLANRYRDYGWPATIVFAPDGTEIVKRQGYIERKAMARLLAAIVRDPNPEQDAAQDPEPAQSAALAQDVRDELRRRHRESYDPKLGGLATAQKYLDRDSVEYALALGHDGDAGEMERAAQTLRAAEQLIDPVWGGVYQYSTFGDWKHPHYEKLATIQGEYLRAYSLAFRESRDPRDRQAADAIRRYLQAFLEAPDGGYYTSQDADLRPGEHSAEYFAMDDDARRALGVPRVDTHRYAREAGTIAEGLAAYYESTGDDEALDAARRAVAWAVEQRRRADGGYKHGVENAGVPYLGDTLAMGRALLALYRVTGRREYLAQSSAAADFIAAHFRGEHGFLGAERSSTPIAPTAQIDENLALARYATLLAHYTGRAEHRAIAEHAFAWLAERRVALSRLTEAGILLMDRELGGDPLHLTVVGPKDDPAAKALFQAALRTPGPYKRVEWWDRAEGPLSNADVEYPPLKRAAAFVCTERRCSVPLYRPEEIGSFLAESRAAPAP